VRTTIDLEDECHRRRDLRELVGTVGIRPDYDHKRLRTEER
jgi:hypothetical protein